MKIYCLVSSVICYLVGICLSNEVICEKMVVMNRYKVVLEWGW